MAVSQNMLESHDSTTALRSNGNQALALRLIKTRLMFGRKKEHCESSVLFGCIIKRTGNDVGHITFCTVVGTFLKTETVR